MEEDLISRIIRHEGFTPIPKPDAKNMFVVGYGHDLDVDEVPSYMDGVSQPEALTMLENDLAAIKLASAKAFPWLLGLDDIRTGVIYEMAYQIGVEGVQEFHMMISAIRSKNWQAAHDQMIQSVWDKETPSRCTELANIMLKG